MKEKTEIKQLMDTLIEHLSEDLIEYWENPSTRHIGATLDRLDRLINGGKGIKKLRDQIEYFSDHANSMQQWIDRGR